MHVAIFVYYPISQNVESFWFYFIRIHQFKYFQLIFFNVPLLFWRSWRLSIGPLSAENDEEAGSGRCDPEPVNAV